MAEPGRLISFRSDRLGARLISLVNTMRICADHGHDFLAYWPFATDVTAVFNDPAELLDADFVQARFIERDEWMRRRRNIHRIGDVIRQGVDFLNARIAAGEDVSVDQAFGINVLNGEDPDAVKQSFLATLDRVPFAAALHGPIQTVTQALTGSTAYHIRRGDLTDGIKAMNKPWPHKMVPDEFYERHMEHTLGEGGGSAVLFSDDAGVLDHYTRAFPALRTIHNVLDLSAMTEAQRDFIELYAMSRAAKIIAPERSAFSSTAVDLGNAVKCSVTEDMTPEMSAESYERLLIRLRDRPDSFPGEGQIGQSLAHIGPYLEQNGRVDEAVDLFAARVRSGLNIAFIYPDTMRFQHQIGDTDGVLEVGRHMLGRHVIHNRYFVDAEIQHGYAFIRRGETEQGLAHITNAFWHGANVGDSRLLVPALVETGLLNARNFIPVSRVQLALHRRRGPLKHLVTQFPEIFKMPGVGVPTSLGTMDTAIWDWAPLLRSVSVAAAAKKGDVARLRGILETAATPPELELERKTLLAVLAAFTGDAEQAIETLTHLTQQHPGDLMAWQRLSHAHWFARNFEDASEAAQQAVANGGNVPVAYAWAGMTALRVKKWGRAEAHLLRADAAGIGLASIPSFLAQTLLAQKKLDRALDAIDRAMTLAPMEVEFALTRAQILERLGRDADAIDTLTLMVERDRAPAKLFVFLIRLLDKTGNQDGVARMIATAQERFPDHPLTAKLVAQHAA